ncbi:unnamed protein product [Ambrosiozyma monospora]|uniref:Unnamed protein product n=1 Tax=Ambrosiozyma monospora TaxID=43982 RepID=A0ACB5U7Y4_AMBMO|nr:unnamed protein product [Ambrosiozyma monospora]
MTTKPHNTEPIKIIEKVGMFHFTVKVKAKNKTINMILPANKKYFLLSLDSNIGKPGINNDLLSVTTLSDKANNKPPITETFLNKKTASKNNPYMIPCKKTMEDNRPVAISGFFLRITKADPENIAMTLKIKKPLTNQG